MPDEQIGVPGHGGPGEGEQIDGGAGGAESGEPPAGPTGAGNVIEIWVINVIW